MSGARQPRPPVLTKPEPGLRCVLADNPSPMTYWGTNSYIVGNGEVAVIDPGPADPGHLESIKNALRVGEKITHIFVTHAHLDHSSGARLLSGQTGAKVYAFGPATAGRSERMARLAQSGEIAGGEGVDAQFMPDQALEDGASIAGGDWSLTALWTPGHFSNHLSFSWDARGCVFTGDLVMGWASSLVSPPDGDLGAFMRSLDRLSDRTEDRVYYPGHGAPVLQPHARVSELRAHRQVRHQQILAELRQAPGSATDLAHRIYTETPAALLPAAARNVQAHLLEMVENSEAECIGPLHAAAQYRFLKK
ncbi:MAG: MBL fold metallo-hydrolase [Pseudomonadota bacterium]